MELNFVIQDAQNIKHMLELLDHCPPNLQVCMSHLIILFSTKFSNINYLQNARIHVNTQHLEYAHKYESPQWGLVICGMNIYKH